MKINCACFETSKSDGDLIRQIVERVKRFCAEQGIDYDPLTCDMDITATHANGCPLDLAKLLAAPDFDFVHDVFGIRRHINRETGQLERLFLPRCARPENG